MNVQVRLGSASGVADAPHSRTDMDGVTHTHTDATSLQVPEQGPCVAACDENMVAGHVLPVGTWRRKVREAVRRVHAFTGTWCVDRRGLGPVMLGWTAEQTSRGRSVVYVGVGGEIHGAMSFGDELKPGVAASVRHLKHEGIRWITVLSGDHPDAVRAIAADIGADEVKAGLLPHEKVDVVRTLVASSRGVAMVGDGVNDAPTMASATIGISMGPSAPTSPSRRLTSY